MHPLHTSITGRAFVSHVTITLPIVGEILARVLLNRLVANLEQGQLPEPQCSSISVDDEVNIRIAKASSAFGRLRTTLWERRGVSQITKLKVYRAMVLPRHSAFTRSKRLCCETFYLLTTAPSTLTVVSQRCSAAWTASQMHAKASALQLAQRTLKFCTSQPQTRNTRSLPSMSTDRNCTMRTRSTILAVPCPNEPQSMTKST